MDVANLFSDLESNNLTLADESKKRFSELFGNIRESWLSHSMMDYFGQTASIRIVDILVKVQQPHDKFILDKLVEWIRSGSNRMLALTLFGHIIQKRPTWLHKVGTHPLVKEVLKLSKMEREIIPLINAVLCIINLLPVIPLVMGSYVKDLFDIFNYLVTFDRDASKDQLIHLQFGLYELFNRLYGMYPCNFISFLKREYRDDKREYRDDKRDNRIDKRENQDDKQAVFQHTIKPLLDTVKIHPRLISSDNESEIGALRWKNMEPHDVVNECARMSLEYLDKSPDTQLLASNECPCFATPIKPIEFSSVTATVDIQWKATVNFFNTDSVAKKIDMISAQNCYVSPNNVMQPTPPPGSGTVPHTPNPTPSYTIPSISGPLLPAADGASPPEAAVEATPETTPMKDTVKPVRPFPVNSSTARAMFNTSQPSSPIRKEPNHFSYEQKGGNVVTKQKLLRMMNDRNHSMQQLSNSSNNTTATSTNNSVPSSPLPIDQDMSRVNQLISNLKLTPGGTVHSTRYDSLLTNQNDCDQDDEEVKDINSHLLHEQAQAFHSHSQPVHPMKEAFDVEDLEQEEGSPCSAGGLHFKNSQSMINFTRNRYRMHSQCMVDSDPSYSTGTSPADTSSYMKNGVPVRSVLLGPVEVMKKHQRRHSLPDLKKYSLKVDPKTLASERQDLTLVETNGDSSSGSSPSEEEAISAATHFHKKQEQKNKEQNNRNLLLFLEIRKNLTNVGSQKGGQHSSTTASQLVSSGTQTIDCYPQPYEQIVYGLLQEELKYKSEIALKRNEEKTDNANKLYPNAMLDKYIELCVKKRMESGDPRRIEELYRDHITLLNLQLQYEKHRRDNHAERNRRLLGKSRMMRALEQDNVTLKEQVSRLTEEIGLLNTQLAGFRQKANMDWTNSSTEVIELKERYAAEKQKNEILQERVQELTTALSDETSARKEQMIAIEAVHGELFDLKNEMQQALHKADLGQRYRDELTRLQSEMILMGEIQLKCKERLAELESLKARDEEHMMIQAAYLEESKELRLSLELKSALLDSAKDRLTELEQQLQKRDETIANQKRTLKTIKEEHKEQFSALECKYNAQKAIVTRLEESILGYQVNAFEKNPDSDKTDAANSLDHTSPLSISLASSEGLSEIKNLALAVQSGDGNPSHELDSNLPTPTSIPHPPMDIVHASDDIPGPSQRL